MKKLLYTTLLIFCALFSAYSQVSDRCINTQATPDAVTPTNIAWVQNTNSNKWHVATLPTLFGTSDFSSAFNTNGDTRYYPLSNPSNYLSGNQSITLIGHITGSGTTSITTTIPNGTITTNMLSATPIASSKGGTGLTSSGLTAGDVLASDGYGNFIMISLTGVYEPAFSKNTAFNKNYGSSSGTTMEGNDSRANNGQTAFGWGNHASAGYLLASTASSTYQPIGVYLTASYTGFDSRYLQITSSLDPANVTQTSTYRFVSDSEKSTWNAKLSVEVDGSVTNEIELASQTGNSGKILTTNGTTTSWINAPTQTVKS